MPLAKPRVTPHQKEVLDRLTRLSRSERRWVSENNLGSHSALWHLKAKGYVEAENRPGPRGGAHYYYRPVAS